MDPSPGQVVSTPRENAQAISVAKPPVYPERIAAAREARGYTQGQLADLLGVTQGTISKLEDGLIGLSEEVERHLVAKLRFPAAFYRRPMSGEWSAVGLYRRRLSLPVSLLKKVEARMKILKASIAQLLIEADAPAVMVPNLDADEVGSVDKIAAITRLALRIPSGAIRDLTEAMESAGCIIVPFEFETSKIDGCSDMMGETPVIFVNNRLNAVRYRFTLAHELGHLVMHRLPGEDEEQEAQANRFAGEFLLPKAEILESILPTTINRMARLKLGWRVSIQCLLRRAFDLGAISERNYRARCSEINRLGYRFEEPYDSEIPKERPRALQEIVDIQLQDFALTRQQLAEQLAIHEDDLAQWLKGEPVMQLC